MKYTADNYSMDSLKLFVNENHFVIILMVNGF